MTMVRSSTPAPGPGRRRVRHLAACLLALAAPIALHAQDAGIIQGRVVSAATQLPLADVTVRLEGTRQGAVTGADGRYQVTGVADGPYVVIAQRVGLATARHELTIAGGGPATADFALGEQAALLAPTVVSASREVQRRTDASATIDVLDGAEVRRSRAAHPAQIMNRLPGVHVSVLSGEGHSMAIRQPITTKPMYLYLEDGVPTRATGFFNHHALYEVNIPQSGGIEVLKGPGTALYGSDAIGGVVNVLTRPAPTRPTMEASMEGGAYGYGRLLASGGTTAGRHGVRLDLNLTRSDGWKDGAAYDRQSGSARWDYVGASGLTVKTVVTASNIDQQDVPTVGQAMFDTLPSFNRAPIAFRDVQAVRLSAAVEQARGPALWSVTPYARYNSLALIPSWQLSYDPQVWDTRSRSLGMLAKYRRDFVPLQARVIAGVDLDYSPGSFVAQQVVTSPENGVWASYTVGETHYDYDVTYRAASPYLQVELSPLSRLRLDAGVRWDLTGYDYRSHLAPLATGPHRRPADTTLTYTHLSPKVGLTYNLRPEANLFASYRHGFRAPSQGQLFQQNSAENTVGLRPVKVDSYELGVRGEAAGRLVYQLSAYDMTIRDDIFTFTTAENLRVASNAGRTRHRGVEVSGGVLLPANLRVDASYSVGTQRYVTWVPQAARPATGTTPAVPEVSYSGNDLEAAPRDLASALVTWAPPVLRDGRVALEWSHTGRYAMDAANTHEYGGYDLLAAHANYLFTPNAELFVRATNLLGKKYAEIAAYDPFQREQYNPGQPRSVFAGVRLVWER